VAFRSGFFSILSPFMSKNRDFCFLGRDFFIKSGKSCGFKQEVRQMGASPSSKMLFLVSSGGANHYTSLPDEPTITLTEGGHVPMGKDRVISSVNLRWTAVFFLAAVGFIVLGIIYYRYEVQHLENERYEVLSSIAKVKSDAIQDWRRRRIADAHRVSLSPLARREIAHLLQYPKDPSARANLQIQLNLNRRKGIYEDALFLDTQGNILLSDNPNPAPVDQVTIKAMEVSLNDRTAVLSDFFRTPGGPICIDAVAPILDDSGQPIAMVVLRTNAADFLYPFIQTWPTPSKTAETLLVCRDGDSALFLNELRHNPDAALTLRFPLAATHVPGVQAVLGNYGRFRGGDYRGVDVLAFSQPVSLSPWSIVAKIDAEEILAEVRYRAGVVAIIVFLMILISAGLIIIVYQKRQEGEHKLAADMLRESEERFSTAFQTSPYAIAITRAEDGKFIEVNNAFTTLSGFTREEAQADSSIGLKLWVNMEDRARIVSDLRAGRAVVGHECQFRMKGGKTFMGSFSARAILLGGEQCILSSIEDITERKQAEEMASDVNSGHELASCRYA
jgi:PAS domain S-box-containing protein